MTAYIIVIPITDEDLHNKIILSFINKHLDIW